MQPSANTWRHAKGAAEDEALLRHARHMLDRRLVGVTMASVRKAGHCCGAKQFARSQQAPARFDNKVRRLIRRRVIFGTTPRCGSRTQANAALSLAELELR